MAKPQKIDKNLTFVRLISLIFTALLIGGLIQEASPYLFSIMQRSDRNTLINLTFTIAALGLTSYQIFQTARSRAETENKETVDSLKEESDKQAKWIGDRIDAIEETINKRFELIDNRNSYIEGLFQDISIRLRTHEEKLGHPGITEQVNQAITKIAELKGLINTEPKINILINKLDKMQTKLMRLTNAGITEEEDEYN